MKNGWLRVSPKRECPVCRKPDWCSVSRDGSAAICQRVESGKRCGDAGYLHRLRDGDAWRSRQFIPTPEPRQSEPVRDFGELAEQYRAKVNPFELMRFAADLGVSLESLRRLAVGRSGDAWAFPMRDAAGRVTGLRLRYPDGRKLSVRGGREGLFIPRDLSADGPVFITEGPTDTAALLTLELSAVGRPSCTGGAKLCADLLRGRDVVIVSDADEPGQRGAQALGQVLRLSCLSVRIIEPPAGVKDARQWVKAGATRGDVLRAAEAATPIPRWSAAAVESLGGAW